MNGYGRGYYGGERLDRQPGSGRGWLKIAVAVVGGGVLWYWWPRKRTVIVPMETLSSLPTSALSTSSATELEQIAHSRGFSSVKDYEDSVLAITRDLKLTGAKIELPPHLQYLMPRVEGVVT